MPIYPEEIATCENEKKCFNLLGHKVQGKNPQVAVAPRPGCPVKETKVSFWVSLPGPAVQTPSTASRLVLLFFPHVSGGASDQTPG